MQNLRRGSPTPERREGRARLSVRDPLTETLLRGLGFEGEKLAEMRAACKALVRERNAWDVRRRAGGIFGTRLISKDEAERLLSRSLAEMAGGRA